jgi:hypothetical protein
VETPTNTGPLTYKGPSVASPHPTTSDWQTLTLGYPRSLIHDERMEPYRSAYVLRQCEGCERTLQFTPLPGVERVQTCSKCHRRTVWRVVA